MKTNNDISFEIGLLQQLSQKVSENPTPENIELLDKMKIRLRDLQIDRILAQID